MANDTTSVVVREDKTILTLGTSLIEKRRHKKAVEVSQNMRLLRRLVIEGVKQWRS